MEHLTVTPSKARIRVSEKATQQGGGFESGATPYDCSQNARRAKVLGVMYEIRKIHPELVIGRRKFVTFRCLLSFGLSQETRLSYTADKLLLPKTPS